MQHAISKQRLLSENDLLETPMEEQTKDEMTTKSKIKNPNVLQSSQQAALTPDTLSSWRKTTSATIGASGSITTNSHRGSVQARRFPRAVFARDCHRRASRRTLHNWCSPWAEYATLPVSIVIVLDHTARRTRREHGVLIWWTRRCCRGAATTVGATDWDRALVCRRTAF
jgi:hypothetical protein